MRLFYILLVLLSAPVQAETVTRVLDGDTLQVGNTKIRLLGIDAPESSQRFGDVATEWLTYAVLGKDVRIEGTEKDRYGRTLAKIILPVTVDGKVIDLDIAQAMVVQGLAWHYVKYSDDIMLQRLQNEAKARRAGIWVDARHVAPWDYRNGQRVPSAVPKNLDSTRETDRKVYITETGTKYHTAYCRHLSKSKIEIPLSRAESAYEPCGTCKP